MTVHYKSWNDKRLMKIMGTLLQIGVLTAAILVLSGGILFFIQHKGETIDYTVFRGEPARLRQIPVIIHEALNLKSRAVIQAGLLILIATPIARVVLSFLGFMLEKDWFYVFITFVVLMILAYSLFSSHI